MVDWAGVCGMASDDYPGEGGQLYHEGEHYDPAMTGHPGLAVVNGKPAVVRRPKRLTRLAPVVTCRYCGTRNLRWTELDSGWRLKGVDGEVHSCKQYRREE